MTRVTFEVSSSSFVANMAMKQNALVSAHKYSLASKVVENEFYVDDCLTEEDTVEHGIELQRQLQELFNEAEFTLRKCSSEGTFRH